MPSRPIRVRFVDPCEIRMGSPYNCCRVVLTGRWVPELPHRGEGYQDLSARSRAGDHLGLVHWDIRNNDPGFRVVVIHISSRKVTRSRRILGCCKSLKWSDGGFSYEAFRVVQGLVAVRSGDESD